MSPVESAKHSEGDIVVQVVPLLAIRSLGRRVFDYRLACAARPPAMDLTRGTPMEGALVRVPFGGRTVLGIVVAEGSSGAVDLDNLLVAERVDADSVPPEMLELAGRLADYYLAPWGACLRAVTPAHLLAASRPRREHKVTWVALLEPASDLGSPMSAAASPSLTEKQRRLLGVLPSGGLPVADACRLAGVGRAVVDALVRKGSVKAWKQAAAVDHEPIEEPPRLFDLTGEQEAAVKGLLEALTGPEPERRLLWGVTGSGKTEVYLAVLEEVVRTGGSAIVLVPEIALTGQLVARLRSRFGGNVGILHSALSSAQRVREHRRMAAGDAQIVVGARSAVFAPLTDLKVIIVDEAHDSSYKQQDEPRYDARTVAWWRICHTGGLLIEGTATPRVESLAARIPRLILRERPASATLPQVEVIDMRRQGGRAILAPRARAALDETLGRGEQAVVLLNRRGYAGFLQCEVCGEVQMCARCEISLTYHRQRRSLVCHHCGLQVPPPALCPSCGRGTFSRGSPGTEKLVEELQRSVPRERLFRLDSDVVTGGTRVDEVLAAFARSSPGVLLGTQMVAKGHDFPLVTLVVVADADTGLYVPDFRATERTFQLLVQVSGRAGRAQQPGRVLVQTWNPEVGCIRMAVDREVEGFYRGELDARERHGYPPYRNLIRLVCGSHDEERAEAGARYLAQRLRVYLQADEVQGPARLPRLRGRSRWQLVVAAADGDGSRALVARAAEQLRGPYARRGLDLMIDVDPQWFT
jgi:primosomal protein N' (replication factor Y)